MVGSKSNGPKGFDALAEIGRRLTQLADEVQNKFENSDGDTSDGHSSQRSFTIDTPQGPLTGVAGYSFRFGGLHDGAEQSSDSAAFKEVQKTAKPQEADVREPLIDIYDEQTEILITAEVPGIHIDDVKVELIAEKLVIETFGDRKFHKVLTLPDKTDPASLTTHLRNGILDIRLKKQNVSP